MTATVEAAARCGQECRATARRDGVVPALHRLNAVLSPDAPPRGASGHALVPVDAAPLPGGGGATAPGLALSAPDPDAQAGVGRASAHWRLGLAWVRLGASEGLRDLVLVRLGERHTEGAPLLMKQLVKGALADVLTEHLEAECVLGEAGTERHGTGRHEAAWDEAGRLGRVHDRITRADRALLRLLGAQGFTLPGPGWEAHLSELLADVYRERRVVVSPEEA
ncbi:hypothetical protein [Streptacidiphilus melanogenes]|uniref:hypothetical protein n=1 Tax=Streptacidiphilus melanogenes TaxID=411235 RepID=UPI0005AB3B6C|nr:hypothetical protein [Streptacidiphilus melanogenes]